MVIDKLLKIEHNYNIDFKIFLLGKKIFSHGYYRKQSGRLTIDEISRRLEQYLYVLSNVDTENKKDENSKYVWHTCSLL